MLERMRLKLKKKTLMLVYKASQLAGKVEFKLRHDGRTLSGTSDSLNSLSVKRVNANTRSTDSDGV